MRRRYKVSASTLDTEGVSQHKHLQTFHPPLFCSPLLPNKAAHCLTFDQPFLNRQARIHASDPCFPRIATAPASAFLGRQLPRPIQIKRAPCTLHSSFTTILHTAVFDLSTNLYRFSRRIHTLYIMASSMDSSSVAKDKNVATNGNGAGFRPSHTPGTSSMFTVVASRDYGEITYCKK